MPSLSPAAQPRALIVTLYGLYARDGRTGPAVTASSGSAGSGGAGWLPIALLVRLLAELGVDEPAVRSAISRLKRRGFVVAARRDGVAGYGLSALGDRVLAEGDARIFAPTEPRLSDGWVLAVFSVPETERAKRHTLRAQLGALGYGACAPGVWIAPAHRFELTVASLRQHGLTPYVDLFRAQHLAFGDIGEHARAWWDLAAVAGAYQDFVREYRELAAAPAPAGDAGAFASWIRALTAWRRLPYLDPGLPVELLPPGWPAGPARDVFASIQDRLASPAREFVGAAVG